MPESAIRFRDGLVAAVRTAAALAAADFALMIFVGGVRFNEYALWPIDFLRLSPAGYALLLLLLLAAGWSAFFSVVGRVAPPRNSVQLMAVSAASAPIFFGAILGIVRARSLANPPLVLRYEIGLAAAALGLAGIAFGRIGRPIDPLVPTRSRPRPWISLALIGLIFAAPLLEKNVSLSGAWPARNRSRPNILVLVLDTLRADALSCLGGKAGMTPSIDRIAGQGLLFRRAVAPASWTAPVHASLFTGLHPAQHTTIWNHLVVDDGVPTLAEILRSEGYRTAAFSENALIRIGSGFDRGFNDFYESFLAHRDALVPFLLDRFVRRDTEEYTGDTIGRFERWLGRNARRGDDPPFFAFLNLMAAHMPDYARPEFNPFLPPRSVSDRVDRVSRVSERNYLPSFRLSPAEMDVLRMFYRGDVAYLDSCLNGLFQFLERSGLLDETVLILTADHGENFGDHGLIEHGYCVYNTLLHVPLIIRYPPLIAAGTARNDIVSSLDIFETILDLVGVPEARRPKVRENRSLLRTGEDRDVVAASEAMGGMIRGVLEKEPSSRGFDYAPFDRSFLCLYSGDRKLIRSSNGRFELYDLSTDWEERLDISGVEPERVKALARVLDDWETRHHRLATKPAATNPRRSVEVILRSLGYVR